jgi:hypothetical protein
MQHIHRPPVAPRLGQQELPAHDVPSWVASNRLMPFAMRAICRRKTHDVVHDVVQVALPMVALKISPIEWQNNLRVEDSSAHMNARLTD